MTTAMTLTKNSTDDMAAMMMMMMTIKNMMVKNEYEIQQADLCLSMRAFK
jgi:hypothetical protein